LGTGIKWSQNLLAVMREHDAVFTALCDVDSIRLERARQLLLTWYAEQGIQQEVAVYRDHRDLLRDRSNQIAVISTPDHAHYDIAMDALESGLDLYLEKPITFTIPEGRRLVGQVRSKGRILQTGMHQRSSLYFRRVCELVRNGKIGKLESIEVRIKQDFGHAPIDSMPVPDTLDYSAWLGRAPMKPYTEHRVHPQADLSRPGWMQVSDYSLGMITNWGTHMLDIALWGLGDQLKGVYTLSAEADFTPRGLFDVHQAMTSELTTPDGVVLKLFTMPDEDLRRPGVTFRGTEGWLDADRDGFSSHDRNLLRMEPGEGDVHLHMSSNHYRDFLQSVRSRQDPACPVEVGHRSNTLCVAYYIAARLGRTLRWDSESERFLGDEEANRMLGV
jgi:myo-inositol 2-dehydrogenase / D-chiro-inositol 1-dehydrogenase